MTDGPATTDKEIGARLREARERAGLSQAQASKLIGLYDRAMSDIENGRRKVNARELIAFSEVYAVGYDWILGQWTDCDLPEEMVAMVEKLPPIDRRKLLATLASFGEMY